MTQTQLLEKSGAQFSSDRRYRYRLWRTWGLGERCAFIMLNPSGADEIDNDPTIERCCRRARSLGFSGIEVGNIFALRSTDPKALYRAGDPIGYCNDVWLRYAARSCALVICGWGAHGALHGRGRSVLSMLRSLGVDPHALGITKAGQPRHPLYISYKTKPTPYRGPLA